MIKLTDVMKSLMDNQSLEWENDHWKYYLHLSDLLPGADDEIYTARPARVWDDFQSDGPDYMYNILERADNQYFIDICRELLEQLSGDGHEVLDDADTLPESRYIEPQEDDE